MSSPTAEAVSPLAASRTIADRFLAAVPLLMVFVVVAFVYAWEAWDHPTPWLFTDELELAQLGRSIAHTGHASLRGEPEGFHTLYTYVTAPAWWLSSTSAAYSAVKYIGVFAMTLTVFPAYGLARMVASRNAALAAAAGATVIPAAFYSSFIVEEALAYPWAALSLYLIAKALLTRGRWWIAGAIVASVLAPLIKGALAPIPGILVLGALLMWWSGERARRWRASWSAADWVGAAILVLIAIVIAGGIASQGSFQYLVITRYRHGYLIEHALKAGGALTIGIGILPLIAAIGLLLRAPGERPREELRVLRCLIVSALLLFGLYTGVKGGYNQYTFATRVWERNIDYVAPLLFAATAVWLDRRRLNLWATAAGSALALLLILWTPYGSIRLAVDAPGLTIIQQANRTLALPISDAKLVLVGLWAVATAVLVLPQLVRLPPRVPRALAVGVAVFLVAWGLTGEIAASNASNSIARTFVSNIRNPMDWLEQRTHGAHTLYLGQQMTEQTSEWLLEFWNPSVKEVWSLDGTAQGPGRVQTPDVQADGRLIGKPPSPATFIVVEAGIDPDGKFVARHAHKEGGGFERWRLYRIKPPLRLLGATTGLYGDGWSVPGGSAYTRYAKGEGAVRIAISRPVPAHVTVRMGPLTIGADAQPHVGRPVRIERFALPANVTKTITVPTPGPRFRVEVDVDRTFVPAELYPGVSSDRRELGAITTYRFKPAQR